MAARRGQASSGLSGEERLIGAIFAAPPAAVAEWQTRRLQVAVGKRPWRFESSQPHRRGASYGRGFRTTRRSGCRCPAGCSGGRSEAWRRRRSCRASARSPRTCRAPGRRARCSATTPLATPRSAGSQRQFPRAPSRSDSRPLRAGHVAARNYRTRRASHWCHARCPLHLWARRRRA
jgi:hypothetical protein